MEQTIPTVLGIDIGSVSVGVVQLTTDKRIVKTAYAAHGGDIAETLIKLVSRFDLSQPPNVDSHKKHLISKLL